MHLRKKGLVYMTNPFLPLLKADHQKAILHTLPIFLLLTIIVFVGDREAFILLLFLYISSTFYIDSFIKRLVPQQKMLMILPAPSEQLIQAVFVYALRYIGLLILIVIPFYSFVTTIEENRSTLSEHVLMYCVIASITVLNCSLYIWIYFTLKHRQWLTLLQITALFFTLLVNFNLFFLFETLSLPIAIQLFFFVGVYGGASYVLYRLTLKNYYNFNILS